MGAGETGWPRPAGLSRRISTSFAGLTVPLTVLGPSSPNCSRQRLSHPNCSRQRLPHPNWCRQLLLFAQALGHLLGYVLGSDAMWDWHDAWILQSIVYAAGRRTGELSDVMGQADAINVDIPTREGLERSVNRLATAGLVRPEGTTFRARRLARRLVRKAGGWRLGIREITPLVEAGLQTLPFPESVAEWSLSDGAWQDAYDTYYPPARRAER